uniref:AlNc14C28G2711 protein n=1 Tax=Albugo laibachii Nc14 TaxID=890382 RepID=F0W788_9STRA|nr:AlNc14C28G2711 [Albugo laibachii Nc14]|eukprot:CCA16987.1 AlNc14C28G2711 [Albugo laibachii Nc14]
MFHQSCTATNLPQSNPFLDDIRCGTLITSTFFLGGQIRSLVAVHFNRTTVCSLALIDYISINTNDHKFLRGKRAHMMHFDWLSPSASISIG